MSRASLLGKLRENPDGWDLIVIGGGATGLRIALDAASRGYSTALVEQADFGEADLHAARSSYTEVSDTCAVERWDW